MFVTRKITQAVAEMYKEFSRDYRISTVLTLGNLNAVRDWGHAKDFVKGYC